VAAAPVPAPNMAFAFDDSTLSLGANEAPVWGRKLQDSPSRSSGRIAAMMG